MRTILALCAVLLLLVSCAPQPPDMAAIKKTVDEFDAASKESMLNGTTDKVLAYYEDNAMEMAPNAEMVKGKTALKAFMESMMKSGMKISEVKFGRLEVDASGKVAYVVGTYDMTASMPNMGEVKDKGKYLAIWRQQPDGSWKVHAETWNTDMPMPPMDQMMAKKDTKKKK